MKNKNIKIKKTKRGSELVQTMLITAVMVVVIATIFFPQIQTIFTKGMSSINEWFESALSAL